MEEAVGVAEDCAAQVVAVPYYLDFLRAEVEGALIPEPIVH